MSFNVYFPLNGLKCGGGEVKKPGNLIHPGVPGTLSKELAAKYSSGIIWCRRSEHCRTLKKLHGTHSCLLPKHNAGSCRHGLATTCF